MKKPSKKILSLILTVLLVVMLPTTVLADVGMQEGPISAFTLNVATVGFGGKEWYVIGDDSSGVTAPSGHITLLAKDSFGTEAYNSSATAVYENGALHAEIANIYNSFNANEQSLIYDRTIDDLWDGAGGFNNSATLTNQPLWPLSSGEYTTMGIIPGDVFSGNFWLRSPHNDGNAYIGRLGSSAGVFMVGAAYEVRPALNLDLSSVLFASDASGASIKSSNLGVTLTPAQPVSQNLKFTMEDNVDLSLICTDTAIRTVRPGDMVSIDYSDAQTGTNKYVSCVIADDNTGDIIHYGKLSTAASSTAGFTVPTGMTPGSYTIKLFNEECNGDNFSDFASTPIEIDMDVIAAGSGNADLSVNAPAFINETVGYGSVTPQAITITNSGGVDAVITGVTLSGTNFGDFTIGGSGSTVSENDNITTWTVQPGSGLTVGTYTANIDVTYQNGPLSPTTVSAVVSFEVDAPPAGPGVSPLTLNLDLDSPSTSSDTLTISLGQYGNAAAQADIAVDAANMSDISLDQSTLNSDGTVTVTGLQTVSGAGIIVTFSGGDLTAPANIPVTVNVTDSGALPSGVYTISFNANGGSVSPVTMQTGTDGKLPGLPIPTRSNHQFDGWFTTESGGTQITPNTVFTSDDTVYAYWTYIGGSSSGSTGGGSSSTTWTVETGKEVNIPTIATKVTSEKPEASGRLTMTITKNAVQEGITEAQRKWSGRESYGIALTFDNKADGTRSLTAIIEADALDYLISQKVKSLTIQCGIYRITLNEKAIASMDSQTTGNVTAAVTPFNVSGDAQTAIGTRPVFEIMFKDSKGREISSFGTGTIINGIKYAAASGERAGNLFVVKVTDGKAQWLDQSSFDNGWMIWSGSTYSVYGVGYKTVPAFTDTATHWAKDNIDFVVSRGLFSGTSDTTFSPDTAISRGMFVTALGRLSGADVSAYTTSSFTDMKSGSYYLPYVEWAVKNGIVKGMGDNQFATDKAITREEMAVIMQNYAKAAGYTLPVSSEYTAFTDDAKISSFARYAVIATRQAGIINGKDGGRFDPQGAATRAEASAILRRFVELVIDEGTARGWDKNDSGLWMYYNWQGKHTTGWLAIVNTDIKYYLDANGIMVSGKWMEIGGKRYYFYTDGKMARNTTVEGYEVDGDGARTQ